MLNIIRHLYKNWGWQFADFEVQISSMLGRFCGDLGVKMVEKSLPEGGSILRRKMEANKNETNQKQEQEPK